MPEAILIIPAYNEQDNIVKILQQIKNYGAGIDIVVINDGSTDNTSGAALRAGVHVLNLPFNMGYGIALQTGYKYALKKDYKYVLQMDADGQHEPGCIADILNELKNDEYDLIIGSRFLGKKKNDYGFLRRIGIHFFAVIVTLLTKNKITDPTSGFQGLSNNILKFFVEDEYPYDYPDADILILASFTGFKIKEIPVVIYNKKAGKSMHSGLKPVYYLYKMLLSIGVVVFNKNRREV